MFNVHVSINWYDSLHKTAYQSSPLKKSMSDSRNSMPDWRHRSRQHSKRPKATSPSNVPEDTKAASPSNTPNSRTQCSRRTLRKDHKATSPERTPKQRHRRTLWKDQSPHSNVPVNHSPKKPSVLVEHLAPTPIPNEVLDLQSCNIPVNLTPLRKLFNHYHKTF